MRLIATRWSSRITALALALLSACFDSSTAPKTSKSFGDVVLSASVVGTTVSTLVVTVTASDIAPALIFNISATNGTASGTLHLPPGDNRLITIQAYDTKGNLTHQGSKTINVVPGTNPAVSIGLIALSGQVPITATLGPVSIVITPAGVTVYPGSTVQLSAVITAPNGDVVTASPEWATSNPTIAAVDASGNVTGVAPGTIQIAAVYEGVAAVAQLTVPSFAAQLYLGGDSTKSTQAQTMPDGTVRFTNESGASATGHITGNVVVYDNTNPTALVGDLSADHTIIWWHNGTWWSAKTFDAVVPDAGTIDPAGAWMFELTKPVSIAALGSGQYSFTNDLGSVAQGSISSGVASESGPGWDTMQGKLLQSGTKLGWQNGSWWGR